MGFPRPSREELGIYALVARRDGIMEAAHLIAHIGWLRVGMLWHTVKIYFIRSGAYLLLLHCESFAKDLIARGTTPDQD